MRISICGSMSFAKEMIEAKKDLEGKGHTVTVPADADKYAAGEKTAETKWEKIEEDVIRNYFKKIKQSDAVLILNKDKNNIINYVGGNALIEMAFAYVLKKKIFLLNPVPKMHYSDEIEAMQPMIINNDLSKIQ